MALEARGTSSSLFLSFLASAYDHSCALRVERTRLVAYFQYTPSSSRPWWAQTPQERIREQESIVSSPGTVRQRGATRCALSVSDANGPAIAGNASRWQAPSSAALASSSARLVLGALLGRRPLRAAQALAHLFKGDGVNLAPCIALAQNLQRRRAAGWRARFLRSWTSRPPLEPNFPVIGNVEHSGQKKR